MMMSKIAQLGGPGVRFPSEGGVRGKNWTKELRVKNRVAIMNVSFAYYCQ